MPVRLNPPAGGQKTNYIGRINAGARLDAGSIPAISTDSKIPTVLVGIYRFNAKFSSFIWEICNKR